MTEITDAQLEQWAARAEPVSRSSITASSESKFSVMDLASHVVRLVDEVRRLRQSEAHTPTDDGMIAPEDGMTLEELGEAISNWSPAWDGDEAMHSLVYRFLEHYAALDGEVYAAREEHDFEPDAQILFRYDDETGTLVRVPSKPQGEPSDAQDDDRSSQVVDELLIEIDGLADSIDEHVTPGDMYESLAALATRIRDGWFYDEPDAERNQQYGVKPYPDKDDVYEMGEDAARAAVRENPEYVLMSRSKAVPAGKWRATGVTRG